MTDRWSFDRDHDRRSFFHDREVIGDLYLKIRSQGDRDRKIWRWPSYDRTIFFAIFLCHLNDQFWVFAVLNYLKYLNKS